MSLVHMWGGAAQNEAEVEKQEQIVAQYSTIAGILDIAVGSFRGARKPDPKVQIVASVDVFGRGWGRSYTKINHKMLQSAFLPRTRRTEHRF
jgi:hypothetical protein